VKADIIVLKYSNEDYEILRDCEGRDADHIVYNALKDWTYEALDDISRVYVAQNIVLAMEVAKGLLAEREYDRAVKHARETEERERAMLTHLKAKFES
jgi:hypothetical protein